MKKRTSQLRRLQVYFVLPAFAILLCTISLFAQTDCIPVDIQVVSESFLFETNRDSVVVRADKTEEEMSIEAACVAIRTAGYYRIRAGVEYSGGKSNETFFLQVQHEDSSLAGLCDPNAGPFKVINVVEDIPEVASRIIRDAGVFFFNEGSNSIILNHYALIAHEYPDFFASDTAGFDGPESVHIFQFELEYVTELEYDLEVKQSVSRDSVNLGEPFTYELTIRNNGPGIAYDVSLVDQVPDFLIIDSANMALTPDSIRTIGEMQQIYWSFAEVSPDAELKLTLETKVGLQETSVEFPTDIMNLSQLFSVCDNEKSNNADSTKIRLTQHPPLPDVSVTQFVRTDSFSVSPEDTTWFVNANETFLYIFKIKNERNVPAENVWFENALPDSVRSLATGNSEPIRVQIGSMVPFSDTTLSFGAQIAPKMPEGKNLLINRAVVAADSEDTHALGNNVAGDTLHNIVVNRFADLVVTQSVVTDSFVAISGDTAWYADAGETYRYFFRIQNQGNLPARRSTLSNDLPNHVIPRNSHPTGILSFDLGDLAPAQDTTLILAVQVAPSIPFGENLLINKATVSADNETEAWLFNNTAVDTVLNLHEPEPIKLTDLAISQTVRTDSFFVSTADTLWFARAGKTISYSLVITNKEDAQAFDVVVKDVIPDSLFFDGFSAGDTLIWRLGNMAPLSKKTVSFAASVSEKIPFGARVPLVNYASVSTFNEDPTKLHDNSSVLGETVFAFPSIIFEQGCDLFSLNVNVFRPDQGAPLDVFFNINTTRTARLDVYDMTGQHIQKLTERVFREGGNQVTWDGKTGQGLDAGSGVYLVVLRSGSLSCWKKVIVAR